MSVGGLDFLEGGVGDLVLVFLFVLCCKYKIFIKIGRFLKLLLAEEASMTAGPKGPVAYSV